MARYAVLFVVICSLGVTVGASIMLVSNAGLSGAPPDLQRVYGWSIAFLLGMVALAWGYARMVLP